MTQTAVFGGGCFWCTEALFQNLRGVVSVMSGYAGGSMKNPGYHDVATGKTGHAEVIKIEFDPAVIPYSVLLDVFFHTHNPTSLNQQGADVGTQYRSLILTTSHEQEVEALTKIKQLEESKEFDGKIVTEVQPLKEFYEAEDYHRNYYQKNKDEGYCEYVISPKLQHLKETYGKLLNEG